MKPQRFEASNDISEFTLTEVGKEKVKLNDLIKTLKKSTSHVTIKNQLKKASKKEVLQVPLSKPQAEKIKRKVAYEKVTKEVGKWDSVVKSNRSADQIIFPLKEPDYRLPTSEEFTKRFQSKNELEEEVSRLLKTSENVLEQDKVLTVAEEKALKAMSLAEAKARHAELRKMRILLSHKEAKARRQKKIKSKKYHRVLKKEKMKKLMKEFEELQKTDPAAAEEKLKEADKLRILERMTLKHKSTGKWAKQQKLRAKYNIESRSALKEQIQLSHQLTEKVIPVPSEPSVAMNSSVVDDEPAEDGDLLNMYLSSSGVNLEEVKKFKTPAKTKVSEPEVIDVPKQKVVSPISKEVEPKEECNEDLMDETTERKQTLDDFDHVSTAEDMPSSKNKNTKMVDEESLEKQAKPQSAAVNYVAETDFSTETKILDSLVPDDITLGDESIDDDDGSDKMNIMQAFADEDLISEFREDKKAVANQEKPQGIDLFLPGWGSWGGTGIKTSKKKRQRFFIKPIKQVRKDQTLGNVIISEEKDKKAAVHQVSEVPFPYKSIEQFQSIIRQPIGNTWNPETSFKKFIAPQIVTKLGKIIEPMDAEDVEFPSKNQEEGKKGKKRIRKKQQRQSMKKK